MQLIFSISPNCHCSAISGKTAKDAEVVIERHPEDWLAFVIFWSLAFIVFLQFFTRYVLNDSLAWTEEIMRDNGIEACANVLAFARGEVPGGIVNREVLNDPRVKAWLAS